MNTDTPHTVGKTRDHNALLDLIAPKRLLLADEGERMIPALNRHTDRTVFARAQSRQQGCNQDEARKRIMLKNH